VVKAAPSKVLGGPFEPAAKEANLSDIVGFDLAESQSAEVPVANGSWRQV
jgi:hypothetical protein